MKRIILIILFQVLLIICFDDCNAQIVHDPICKTVTMSDSTYKLIATEYNRMRDKETVCDNLVSNQQQIINSQANENKALSDKNKLLQADLNIANDEIEHQKDLKRIIASFGAGLIVVILIIL